jgi:hypothetical protein
LRKNSCVEGGTFVINTLVPGNRGTPHEERCAKRREIPVLQPRESQNVNAEKNASTPATSIIPKEASGREETALRYTSNSYQKVLDYHVSEILLTTIIFGIIILLRLHH